jgi:hypothetical protein
MDQNRKKKAKSGAVTPNRDSLRQSLSLYEDADFPTPLRQNMQATVVQNFASASVEHHQNIGSAPSPQTQLFQLSCAHLSSVGESAIVDRLPTLLHVTKQYLDGPTKKNSKIGEQPEKGITAKKQLFPFASQTKEPVTQESFGQTSILERKKSQGQLFPKAATFTVAREHEPGEIFGGEVPVFSKIRERKSKWDDTVTESYASFHKALCYAPGLGPNALLERTQPSHHSFNSFRVYHLVCRMDSDCKFCARLFYPIENVDGSSNEEDIKESPAIAKQRSIVKINETHEYLGPVAFQVAARHSCGMIMTWEQHLLTPTSSKEDQKGRGKKGMNPILKEAIESMVRQTDDPFRLPKPDAMYNRLLEKLGDDITNLFPTKCLPEVKNQITGYWRNRRRDLLKNIHPSNHELRYLPQLDAFRHQFCLKLPKGYQVPPGSVLATMVSPTLLRRFANSIIVGGGNSTLPNPQVDKDSVQPPEHTMVILPLPPVDDPFVGHIVKYAREKDAKDGEGITEKHFVCFSSIHLLFQGFLAMHRYGGQIMTCIDSSHGGDSGGGKIQSFGVATTKRHGRGSDYRRTFVPFVFSRILQENTVGALLLLSTFLYNVRRLFGVRFDVLGGLISDHANSFVNAYQKVFPNRPIGQCFPHVQLKVLDQPGRRKRGSAGYVTIIRDRKNLTTAAKDVKRMHCTPTDAAKKTFTLLALRSWKLVEKKMAQVFSKSYIESLAHSHWRYNEFGNPGDTPQSNSLERMHLTMKGSRETQGLCDFNKSLDEMLTYQYPRLVHLLSARSGMLQYNLRLLDYNGLVADTKFMKDVSTITEDDFVPCPNLPGSFLANDREFFGYKIDEKRIKHWQMGCLGQFPSDDPSKRTEFFEAVSSLVLLSCRPLRETGSQSVWQCSCHTFWSTTACSHTFFKTYGTAPALSLKSQPVKEQKDISSRYTHKVSGFEVPDTVGQKS